MRPSRKNGLIRAAWMGGLALACVGAGAAAVGVARTWNGNRRDLEGLARAAVRRADLRVTLTASGRVESAKQTTIECKLEKISLQGATGGSNSGGASTIIELVPEGTLVKEGEVICRLDASDYEEMVRQQQIQVEQAHATRLQAALTLEVAEVAVREYRDGLRKQMVRDYEGQIALLLSDVQRQSDRVAWADRMKEKGYVARAQLSSEKALLQQSQVNLAYYQALLRTYDKYTAPRTIRELEGQIEGAKSTLLFEESRVRHVEERLEFYKSQVEHCTIRAPHDGLVIYANKRNRPPVVDLGLTVFQKQRLFILPDLDSLEVQAMLHETVVDRVAVGMPARVKIEALPGRSIEGDILAVAPLPLFNGNQDQGNEVKYYLGRIKLHSVPGGLRPGMTAEVQIETGQRHDALVIPPDAVAYEGGQEVCYVADEEGVRRREVSVGSATSGLIEVTDGLEEGEQVVLEPGQHHLDPAHPAADEPAQRLGQ